MATLLVGVVGVGDGGGGGWGLLISEILRYAVFILKISTSCLHRQRLCSCFVVVFFSCLSRNRY